MQKAGNEIAILKALINARYYFESLPIYSSDKTGFVDKETGYVFNSTNDLLDTLHKIGIQGDSLNEVGAVLEEWYELYKQQQETITEAPRPVEQDATTLTSDQLENLEEYARSRNEQNADIRSREKQRIDDFINEYEEKIAKAKSLQNKLINKNIYAKVFIPKEEDLTQDEQNKLDILKDYANDEKNVGSNGLTRKQILINDLTVKIEEILEPELKNLTQEEKILIAQTYAVKLVNEIAKPVDNTFNIQTAVLINISKEIDSGSNTIQKSIPEDSLIRQAREGSIFLEIESRKNQFTTREIAGRIFNTKITSAILGTDPEHILINFIEDKTLEAPTHIINLGSLNNEYTRILDEQTKLIRDIKENDINNISSFITSDTRQFLGTIISKSNVGKLALKDPVLNSVFSQYVLGKKVIFQAVYQSKFVKLAVDLIPNAGPVLALTGKALGITIVKPIAKEIAKDVAVKALSETTKTAVVKLGAAKSIIAKILATAGSVGGWIGTVIGYVIGTILVKLADKLKDWWTRNKDNLGPVVSIIATIGGLIFFGPVGGVVSGGLALAATGTLGTFATGTAAVLGFISSSIGITVATSVIVTVLIIPPLIAFIMLVINNNAYLVPPKTVGTGIIHIPPGGNLTKCGSETTGLDITQKLASSIRSGSVQLLPDSLGSRQEGLCITPTMIVLHTSSGYDNDDGNIRTFETLVDRNVSCQLATDTNDTILMLNFFEKQVENSWCADNLNNGGISIEMAGEPDPGFGPHAKCSPTGDLTFTPDGPHPCKDLEDLSFDAVCKIMQQYKIPWTQVVQHEASNGTHVDPNGDAWVDKFILRLKNNCPISNDEINVI